VGKAIDVSIGGLKKAGNKLRGGKPNAPHVGSPDMANPKHTNQLDADSMNSPRNRTDIDDISLLDSQRPDNFKKELEDNLPEDLRFAPYELPVRSDGVGGKIYDRKITPQEMHDLTGIHEVEFALTQNLETGKYRLSAGEITYDPDGRRIKQSVNTPGDEYLHYHTHPSGSPIASDADLDGLRNRYNNIGQKISHIIPYNQGKSAQLMQFNYNDTYELWHDRLQRWIGGTYP